MHIEFVFVPKLEKNAMLVNKPTDPKLNVLYNKCTWAHVMLR